LHEAGIGEGGGGLCGLSRNTGGGVSVARMLVGKYTALAVIIRGSPEYVRPPERGARL